MSTLCDKNKMEYVFACLVCKVLFCEMCIKKRLLCNNLEHEIINFKEYQEIIKEESEKILNQDLINKTQGIRKLLQDKEIEI